MPTNTDEPIVLDDEDQEIIRRFEQVRERNLRALQHEAETPMRGHTATCCAAAAVGSA